MTLAISIGINVQTVSNMDFPLYQLCYYLYLFHSNRNKTINTTYIYHWWNFSIWALCFFSNCPSKNENYELWSNKDLLGQLILILLNPTSVKELCTWDVRLPWLNPVEIYRGKKKKNLKDLIKANFTPAYYLKGN